MIEEHAIIINVHASTEQGAGKPNNTATIEIVRKSACGICGKTRGCGNALWGKMFAHKTPSFIAENTIGAKVGQSVIVGIEEQALMKTALLLYIVPLVMLFFGAILSSWLFSSEGYIMLGAAIGMLFGFVWVKAHAAGHQYYQNHQPKILRFDHAEQQHLIQFQ